MSIYTKEWCNKAIIQIQCLYGTSSWYVAKGKWKM